MKTSFCSTFLQLSLVNCVPLVLQRLHMFGSYFDVKLQCYGSGFEPGSGSGSSISSDSGSGQDPQHWCKLHYSIFFCKSSEFSCLLQSTISSSKLFSVIILAALRLLNIHLLFCVCTVIINKEIFSNAVSILFSQFRVVIENNGAAPWTKYL